MTPALLSDQRCWIHAAREAAARCPECQRFFCRECITEHSGRMMCAECVERLARAARSTGRSRAILWTALSLVGLLTAWLIFYYLGMALARIPSDFQL
jgi:hypothetical protein